MKIFLIGGKAKCGKNTFGNFLKEQLKDYGYKPCTMHITEPLYGYARNYFCWNEQEEEKPREFLQKMGIEIIQEKLGKKDFLLNRLFEDIEILSNFFDVFIITDTRLKREFQEIKKHYEDVTTIKVKRSNYDTQLTEEEENHITEKEIDEYHDFDYIIDNTSLEDLEIEALEVVRKEENYGG
ncbi:MAG: hypothetical protein IKE70_00880 [Bacilli bacterium]|nr:hypothetical protein [Bacilli bacterium]